MVTPPCTTNTPIFDEIGASLTMVATTTTSPVENVVVGSVRTDELPPDSDDDDRKPPARNPPARKPNMPLSYYKKLDKKMEIGRLKKMGLLPETEQDVRDQESKKLSKQRRDRKKYLERTAAKNLTMLKETEPLNQKSAKNKKEKKNKERTIKRHRTVAAVGADSKSETTPDDPCPVHVHLCEGNHLWGDCPFYLARIALQEEPHIITMSVQATLPGFIPGPKIWNMNHSHFPAIPPKTPASKHAQILAERDNEIAHNKRVLGNWLNHGLDLTHTSNPVLRAALKNESERILATADDEHTAAVWSGLDVANNYGHVNDKPTPETDLIWCPERGILNDTDGKARGAFLSLKRKHRSALLFLQQVYNICEHRKKLRPVQQYTQNLLHYNLQSPGFPVLPGLADHELFSLFPIKHVLEMHAIFDVNIKEQLTSMGYCSKTQNLELHLSFLKTLETKVQPPHIDFQWQNISPKDFHKTPRSYKGNYKEWVPFIALFPLTQDGMKVEVWNARSEHDVPECEEDKTGVVVNIPFGEILLLRADVVHAGGFAPSPSGNPRGHFYIYKTPHGALHSYPLSNSYDAEIRGELHFLHEFYKHCSECAETSTVVGNI